METLSSEKSLEGSVNVNWIWVLSPQELFGAAEVKFRCACINCEHQRLGSVVLISRGIRETAGCNHARRGGI